MQLQSKPVISIDTLIFSMHVARVLKVQATCFLSSNLNSTTMSQVEETNKVRKMLDVFEAQKQQRVNVLLY
jgi:hypothetical protein